VTAPIYRASARADAPPAPDDLCVAVLDRSVLLRPATAGWRLPTVAEVATGELLPLGTLDGRPAWGGATDTVPDGLVSLAWLDCPAELDAAQVAVVARALHVVTWLSHNRFCGACRVETEPLAELPGRRCPSCHRLTFTNAQPVALVAVLRDGAQGREVLLARHTYGAMHLWALVGGYVDPAESFEQAARREVAEEVGLTIGEPTYVGSEGWGFSGPSTLLTVFTAEATDPTAEPTVDGTELAEARFFPVNALPEPIPPPHFIAGRVLRALAQ
jgi:NAD+ diphosphatase